MYSGSQNVGDPLFEVGVCVSLLCSYSEREATLHQLCEWLTMPLCPGLTCFFNTFSSEGINSQLFLFVFVLLLAFGSAA